ncbi:Transposon Ty3-G Gag-Pol polyprotein [Thelohanellus kitauei]|uniref:Transposon Ty3-G Gag-Pol polyprotein n=1 Tax=Thelohanellus kitauei TaxID=669202 RepID=A0A0C2MQ83_THEKT|nr:Transposon Ty3-G Gag-Pol polyprotein [Thelohanellus kitauei]
MVAKNEKEQLIHRFKPLFDDSRVGRCNNFEARLHLKEGASLTLNKSCKLPFGLYQTVKNEISRLVHLKILEPVEISEWVFPILLVPKSYSILRVCTYFRVGLISQLMVEKYPIPTIDELLLRLKDTKFFTKIDMNEAYFEIPLDRTSKGLLVIHTPFGLFRYTRLLFGVSSVLALFQRYVESLWLNIPNFAVFLDDIIVSGSNMKDRVYTCGKILQIFQDSWLTCRKQKYEFFKE